MLIPAALRFGSIKVFGSKLYFEESRPQQGGKTFLMLFDQKTGSLPVEVLPPEMELRTKVNEYGGCSFEVGKEGVYFVEKSANQVWVYTHDKVLRQLTHSPHRFAELLDTPFGIVAVQEKAFAEDAAHASQKLVLISAQDGTITPLHIGADFYSNPTLYSTVQGHLISFLSWSHPHMPWGENSLWQATLTATGLKEPRVISSGKVFLILDLNS